MAGSFDMFDRSVGKYDSELECKTSLLACKASSNLRIHSLAIIWMYALQHSFPVGKSLQRIKSPYSVTFL